MPNLKTSLKLLLACLFAALAILLLERSSPAPSTRSGDNAHILPRRLDAINRIVISSRNGSKHIFSLQNDEWIVSSSASSWPASTPAILQLLDAVETAPLSEFIDANEIALRALSLSDFGLDSPSASLELSGPTSSIRISFGNPTPSTNELFAALDSRGVCVTSPDLFHLLSSPLENFVDRHLFRTNLREVDTILIEQPNHRPLRIKRSANRRSWQMVSPENSQADWSAMLRFFENLSSARISSFPNRHSPLRDSPPLLSLKLFSKRTPFPTTLSVLFPLPGTNNLFLASDESGSQFIINNETLNALTLSPNDIRDRRVFLSGPTLDVKRFSLSLPNVSSPFVLDRSSGHDWSLISPLSTPAIQESASQIVGEILALEALAYIPVSRLSDSSLPGPSVTITTQNATNSIACSFLLDAAGNTNLAIVVNHADFAAFVPSSALPSLLNASKSPLSLLSTNVFSFPVSSVSSLSISAGNRSPDSFAFSQNASWSLLSLTNSPPSLPPNSNTLHDITESLASLNARAIASLSPPQNDPFFLSNPRLKISVSFSPAPNSPPSIPPPLTISFGATTPDGEAVYAITNTSDLVFEIPIALFDILAQNPFLSSL